MAVKRPKLVAMRVNGEEKTLLEDAAEARGTTVSGFLREDAVERARRELQSEEGRSREARRVA